MTQMRIGHLGAILVTASMVLGGCSSARDEPTSAGEKAGAKHEHFKAGSKAAEQRRRSQAQRECVEQALNEAQTGTVRCGTGQTVVCNQNGTFKMTDSDGYYNVVCKGNQFVGLAWDSDVHHFFRRVHYLGRWVGKAVPAGYGTRLARPAPPPPAPSPPTSAGGGSSGGLIYSTDNDHEYTGPRCYESGGYYFHPC